MFILSSICVFYGVDFLAYAAAIVFATAIILFFRKSKRIFSLFAVCALCLVYTPIFDSVGEIYAQKHSNYKSETYTAVVEKVSQSYENVTLLVKTLPTESDRLGKKAVISANIGENVPELFEEIRFSGSLLPLDASSLEGADIYGTPFYYYSKGVRFVAVCDGYETLGRQSSFSGLSSFKYKYYYYITDRLKDVFPVFSGTDSFSYIRALLTGDRAGLDDATYETYRKSGLAPFLCISGLHVVAASMFLMALLKKFGFSKNINLIINLVFLGFIALITGAGGSVLRASIMSAVFCISDFKKTGADRLSVLALSFILIFVNNPYCVFDYGTRLSFLAMLGVICASFVAKAYNPLYKKYEKNIKNTLVTGFFAMGFTLPVVLSDFGGVYLLSPFSSLIASVVFTPFMYLLVCIAFLSFLPQTVVGILAFPAKFLLKIFELVAKAFSLIPFSYAELSLPNEVYTITGVLFAVFLFVCAFSREKRIVSFATLFCSILLPSVIFVHLFNVVMR